MSTIKSKGNGGYKMKKILLAVAVMMTMVTTQVKADDKLRCEGVPNVSMNLEWGIVSMDIGYGTWDICSIRFDRNGIKKEVCPTILRAALLAESEGKKVQFAFDAPGMTCADFGDWVAPDPFPYHMNFSK
jgi:hypothetical protein